MIEGGATRYVHDEIHTAAAEAAVLAAAEAADLWINASISFIMKHVFYNETKSMKIKNLN